MKFATLGEGSWRGDSEWVTVAEGKNGASLSRIRQMRKWTKDGWRYHNVSYRTGHQDPSQAFGNVDYVHLVPSYEYIFSHRGLTLHGAPLPRQFHNLLSASFLVRIRA